MKSGYSASARYNLVTLFDGISGSTTGFGEAFADTRLYRIGENKSYRLNGGSQFPNITTTSTNYEANMGDAETLKKFIQYCKSNYPANKYVLIMSNHGGGTRSVKSTSSSTENVKAICWDDTDGEDALYTGEISDTLTSSESVDVMVLDACLMGSVEFAYQFRKDDSIETGNDGFSSYYMVASPALVRGEGLPYTTMLQRIRGVSGTNGTTDTLGGGSSEAYIVPSSTMNMAEFSKMIVEEQYDDTRSISYSKSDAFSVYDLSKVTSLKNEIDNLAEKISNDSSLLSELENARGNADLVASNSMNYYTDANYKNRMDWYNPFFDLYDLMNNIDELSSIKTYANNVQNALSDVVLSSFGGTDFAGFVNNKNGIHIVFPKSGYASYFGWYSPVSVVSSNSYGKLSFCSGGVNTEGNSTVDTWFEMIDKWYDNTSVNSGEGYNYYSY